MSDAARMDATRLGRLYEALRPELVGYLTRLVARVDVAEELAQGTAVRALEPGAGAPEDEARLRRWLFAVATNLALDHLRRHGTWGELRIEDVRRAAEGDAAFVAEAAAARGDPETAMAAREHLAACFSCTLRNLSPEHAAALLLHEVHDLSVEEVAQALGARRDQVKGWLQTARQTLRARYRETCALVRGGGPCWQCVELDRFFTGQERDPLAGTDGGVGARVAVLRALRDRPPGRWPRMLSRKVAQLERLGSESSTGSSRPDE